MQKAEQLQVLKDLIAINAVADNEKEVAQFQRKRRLWQFFNQTKSEFSKLSGVD